MKSRYALGCALAFALIASMPAVADKDSTGAACSAMTEHSTNASAPPALTLAEFAYGHAVYALAISGAPPVDASVAKIEARSSGLVPVSRMNYQDDQSDAAPAYRTGTNADRADEVSGWPS